VGKVLRATGLDALPRLVNVVRGEMSLVGPRPLSLAEVRTCEPDQLVCLALRPGVTGAWRTSSRVSERLSGRQSSQFGQSSRMPARAVSPREPFERMLALDIDYLRHCSFWLDFKLLLALPLALLWRAT
jgi:lipopolysaccharide/colanic/teichoic acid biosynthesis glycosyltransferase